MNEASTALHIRTGDPSAGDAIDAWLRAAGIEPIIGVDAYEACVYLLKHADRVPELVFVGADWLAPDEQVIIRHARDTWPSVGLVIYGAPLATDLAALPLTRTCPTRAELNGLLATPPAALIEQFARDGVPAEPILQSGTTGAGRGGPRPVAGGSLRDGLTRDELSALLDKDDR